MSAPRRGVSDPPVLTLLKTTVSDIMLAAIGCRLRIVAIPRNPCPLDVHAHMQSVQRARCETVAFPKDHCEANWILCILYGSLTDSLPISAPSHLFAPAAPPHGSDGCINTAIRIGARDCTRIARTTMRLERAGRCDEDKTVRCGFPYPLPPTVKFCSAGHLSSRRSRPASQTKPSHLQPKALIS